MEIYHDERVTWTENVYQPIQIEHSLIIFIWTLLHTLTLTLTKKYFR
jgi:hypothetical protein